MQAQVAVNTSLIDSNHGEANKQSPLPPPPTVPLIESSAARKTEHSSISGPDDVDVMLKHEDFPKLLTLAIEIRKCQQNFMTANGICYQTKQELPKSQLSPDETLKATLSLQTRSNQLSSSIKIQRGDYPITDAIMDDSIRMLQRELHDIQNLQTAPGTEKNKSSSTSINRRGKSKKEAIAVKYSHWQTDILMTWMIEHKEAPFPDQKAIEELMQRTGLSHSQVVNWTTNVRKRNRKATCQGGKKPHHFIDFLFLVQDRETQKNTTVSKQQAKKHKRVVSHCDEVPPSLFAASAELPCHHTERISFEKAAHIHPSMFEEEAGNTEPLDINNIIHEDELLKEFSDAWLSEHGQELCEIQLQDLVLLDGAQSNSQQDHPPLQTLLPSITTDDSQDDEDDEFKPPVPQMLGRASSFDVDVLEDEVDLESWANEFGFSFDEE